MIRPWVAHYGNTVVARIRPNHIPSSVYITKSNEMRHTNVGLEGDLTNLVPARVDRWVAQQLGLEARTEFSNLI